VLPTVECGGWALLISITGGPSVGTKLTRGGALLIAAALIPLAMGLIQTA